MRPTKTNFSSYRNSVVELKEGVNENVSSIELKGGELISCRNYMMAEGGYGGYRSMKGFERFDGGLLPSTYESYVLTLENCGEEILDGHLITGSISGATATALEDGQVQSGSYVGGDAVVIVQALIVSGDFDIGESCTTISGTVGDMVTPVTVVGGDDDYNLAIQWAKSEVIAVPGQGPVLGVHIYNQKVYAFRRKISPDTQVGMYVEDVATGWAEVDTSGSPLTYDAGGHNFRFDNYNFYGTTANPTKTFSMYWVDGVNKAREYNGTTVSVIDNAGMDPNDKPIAIRCHNFYLFLAYPQGSLQYSTLGKPDDWTTGAGEIGQGGSITNLVIGQQSSLVIYLDEGINILQGSVESEFRLERFSQTSGAISGTAQRLLGTIFFLDDRGLTTMDAVVQYGDYAANSISQKFKETLLGSNHTVTTTLVSRDLNQYRMYFDDRLQIIVSFEGKELQGSTFAEYPYIVSVSAQGQDSNKEDYLIFASTDQEGYVFRIDSGKSYDGGPIICRMTTAFYHYKSPRRWKAFKRATLEISGDFGQVFDMKVDFDYNELNTPRTIWYDPFVYTVEGSAIYGEDRWSQMVYGTGVAATNRVPVYLQGVGTNMSYKIISNETYKNQHIIQNIITDFMVLNRRV